MHSIVGTVSRTTLSVLLALCTCPAASFGVQAAPAADTPKERVDTGARAVTAPLEDGDVFEADGLYFTVTDAAANEVEIGDATKKGTTTGTGMQITYTSTAPATGFDGGAVVLPTNVEYGGVTYAVTAVGPYAFYRETSITSLTVPSGIKSVDSYAFTYCSSVGQLTLEEGLETIGDLAFALGTEGGASSLTELTIPSSVKSIGTGAFRYLRYLEHLSFVDTNALPSQLSSIGGSAFAASQQAALYYNKVLSEVTVPRAVTFIGSGAFSYNTALSKVVFECDTSTLQYRTSNSAAAAATGWFYKMAVTQDTVVLFKRGAAPRYWDPGIPAYLLLDFYGSYEGAVAGSGKAGSAAVAYGTSFANVAQNPSSVQVYEPGTYGTIPALPSGAKLWASLGSTDPTVVTRAGAVYPFTGSVTDLSYATVKVLTGTGANQVESDLAASYDCEEYDEGAFASSLKVVDVLGNTLTRGLDYSVNVSYTGALGTAEATIAGMGAYAGSITQSFELVLSSFSAVDASGHAVACTVLTQPRQGKAGTVSLGDGANAAYGGSSSSLKTIAIPSQLSYTAADGTVYDFTVTELGEGSFANCASLTTVTLPSTVTTVGYKAFGGCTSLSDITFAEGLRTIGDYAFSGCTSLERVTLPSSLGFLGTTIARDLVNGSYCFNNCTSLREVSFGTAVANGSTVIASRVFQGCTALTKVSFNGNVGTIGFSAFNGVASLTEVSGLRSGVNTISNYAFRGCSSLSVIDGGEPGLLELGLDGRAYTVCAQCFSDCTSLKRLRFGTGVTLDATGFGAGNTPSAIFDGCGATSVEFVGDWREIPASVCIGCEELRSITLPNTVATIGSSAFRGCYALESVTLPAGVTAIEQAAFRDCKKLSSVTFEGANVGLTLGSQLFQGCTSLTAIAIPEGVTSLPSNCFMGCSALTSVSLPSTLTAIESYCFAGGTTDVNTMGFTNDHSVTYDACLGLTHLDLPRGVTTLGAYAFYGCGNLEGTLDIAGVESIGDGTFGYCAKLSRVTISSTLRSVGSTAFYRCTGLTTVAPATEATGVVLPETALNWGLNVFNGCSGITRVTLPSKLTSLPRYLFANCTGLASVTVPEGVTLLDEGCLSGCSGLKELVLPTSVTTFGLNALNGCTSLAALELNEGLVTLGEGALANCEALTSLALPSTLKGIGARAFYNDHRLAWVDCRKVDAAALAVAADAFTTNNTSLNLIFLNQEVPAGLSFGNGNVICIQVPETAELQGSAVKPVTVLCNGVAAPDDLYLVTYTGNAAPGAATAVIEVGSFKVECMFAVTGEPVAASSTSGTSGGSTPAKAPTVKKGYVCKAGNLTYKVTKAPASGAGTVTVTKYSGGAACTIPAKITINGSPYKVTAIAAKAFASNKKLKNLKIGSNVTTVGKNAFKGCKKLTNLVVGAKVATVGKNAFRNCSKLGTVVFNGKKLPKLKAASFKGIKAKAKVGVKVKAAKAAKALRTAGLSKKATVVKL